MKTVLILCFLGLVWAQKDPNLAPGRTTLVHLFEWKWSDIADECERYLGPAGFGGIQVSPPNENVVAADSNRPWWERYQPVSYILTTRSGDEAAFKDMVNRCNAVNVRIYVDAVINHMAALSGTGTAGSISNVEDKDFPAVPFTNSDFHPTCEVNNYQDPENVRNCELVGLKDLDHSVQNVRDKIVEYLNHLVDLGVAGFRVDAAKHMWPVDLGEIYSALKTTQFGQQPYIFQEVIDLGGEPISKNEYTELGNVLEFLFGTKLGDAFQGNNLLKYLVNWGPEWGLLDGLDATVFIDNHDNQRTGSDSILTYKNPKPYKMAIAFMLAHPYGTTRIMSSYAFETSDDPPPQDADFNIISPEIGPDGTCVNGWVCEHRWRQIANMVVFRNTVLGASLTDWWDNGDNQIAFGREDKGFIAFTLNGDINQGLPTSMADGTYCDIISGNLENGGCTGKTVTVSGGQAQIQLGQDEDDGVIAIHLESKL